MHARRWTAALFAVPVLFLFVAHEAFAQQGPPDMPPGLHDRATLPPGTPFDGDNFEPPGHSSQIALSGAAEVAVAAAAREVSAALEAGSFRPALGTELAPGTQSALQRVLTGEGQTKELARALQLPENATARKEARELTKSLDGLLIEPGQLPRAVTAFNAFVMASSEDFLADPPEEFLAVHAALGQLSEAAEAAAEEAGTAEAR